MNEAQILELIYLGQGEQLSMLQWWGGTTFALLTVAHFARKNLNLFLVLLILLLYISFSFYVVIYSERGDMILSGLLDDLRILQETTGQISVASESVLQESYLEEVPFFFFIFSGIFLPGMFLGTIGYVIFMYIKGRH